MDLILFLLGGASPGCDAEDAEDTVRKTVLYFRQVHSRGTGFLVLCLTSYRNRGCGSNCCLRVSAEIAPRPFRWGSLLDSNSAVGCGRRDTTSFWYGHSRPSSKEASRIRRGSKDIRGSYPTYHTPNSNQILMANRILHSTFATWLFPFFSANRDKKVTWTRKVIEKYINLCKRDECQSP